MILLLVMGCYPERQTPDMEKPEETPAKADAGAMNEADGQDSGVVNSNEPVDSGQSDMNEQTTDAGDDAPVEVADAGFSHTDMMDSGIDGGVICGTGFVFNPTSEDCDDVNECDVANGGCEQACVNTDGDFACGCLAGYQLASDDISCTDINECTTGNGGCEQICTNSIGDFECSCPAGYELMTDQVSCGDINECADNNGGCQEICVNSDGDYICDCEEGYQISHNDHSCVTPLVMAYDYAEAHGVGFLSVSVDIMDVAEQEEFGDLVFSSAFDKALESFLNDAADQESPLGVLLDAEENSEGSVEVSKQLLLGYMDNTDAGIWLVPNRDRLSPEAWWPPENQEAIQENWVFYLYVPQLGDHLFWAIVPRDGGSAYNYGFN